MFALREKVLPFLLTAYAAKTLVLQNTSFNLRAYPSLSQLLAPQTNLKISSHHHP